VNRYKVTFLPDQKEIEVARGVTLFEAAEKAGYTLTAFVEEKGFVVNAGFKLLKGTPRQTSTLLPFSPETRYERAMFLLARLG